MSRQALEVADIFRDHGAAWRRANARHVSLDQLKVMSAIERCRTVALVGLQPTGLTRGGHVARCENATCGHTQIAYNSLYGDLYVKLSVGTTEGSPPLGAKHRAATLYSVGSV